MQYLYRAYDSNQTLLYVGISSEWHKRLHTHEKTSEWIEQADWVKLERYDTREEVAKAERLAIETEQPLYNKTFSQSYTHPIHHWAAVKRWIYSGQAEDDFHQRLIDSVRESAIIYEKKAYQLKAAGMAFLFSDTLSYLEFFNLLECRNCKGIETSNMLKTILERGESQLLEGVE